MPVHSKATAAARSGAEDSKQSGMPVSAFARGSNQGAAARARSVRSQRETNGAILSPRAPRAARERAREQATDRRLAEAKSVTSNDGYPDAAGGAAKVETVDLNQPITLENLASALRLIANEPGERGQLSFKVKAQGKVGSGAVNALVAAWANLAISYSITDTNLSSLSIEGAGAVAAGIDLGGFVQGTLEAGYGADVEMMGFSGPENAAHWIYSQLERVNSIAPGVFNLRKREDVNGGHSPGPRAPRGGRPTDPEDPLFTMNSQEAFGGVNANADLGIASADASYRFVSRDTEYVSKSGDAIPSNQQHHQSQVGFDIPIAGRTLGVNYSRDYNITTGSMVFYANGVFCDNELTRNVSTQMRQW